MEQDILRVEGLRIAFVSEEKKVNTAVNGISFIVKRGDTLGIVGESGSGKSVTSLSILGLLNRKQASLQGNAWFHGLNTTPLDVLALSGDEIRKVRGNHISMIFQEPMTSLNPVYTCGDQVEEAIHYHKRWSKTASKEEVLRLFEEVQLPDPSRIFKSYPHELSGGQRQRVMIAMALSCNPELLIADEPTTALDATVQKGIVDLLHTIKKERSMSMLFISHDLGLVAQIADQVIVMYKGHIVENGATDHVFRMPEHPYTKGLLACRPSVNKGLKKLPVVSDFMNVDASGSIEATGFTREDIARNYAYGKNEKADRLHALYAVEPVLKVEGLSKWYFPRNGVIGKAKNPVKAVDGVSFKLYPGETLGLVGESGSGKTTLGRTLLRLTQANEGRVWYKKEDVLQLKAREMKNFRRHAQIIFQDPYATLNPRQRIGDTILEPMTVHSLYQNEKRRKERVRELLKRVNLDPDFYNRYPHEFSGGQRQRIGIARAIAMDPELIICDESVSALDVSVQAQIINLLISLREERKLTYIFISHDLSVVRFISDRIMVMNKGIIEEEGFTDQVFDHPTSAYTRKLLSAVPDTGASWSHFN